MSVCSGAPFNEQLDRDPGNEHAARQLDKLDLQQLGHKKGEDHPEQHRGPGPQDDPPAPLPAGERAHRHGNDHGIIPGQDEVNDDDIDNA